MTIVNIDAKEHKEWGNFSGAENSLSLVSEIQELMYIETLLKLTLECRLAAITISEITIRAVDSIQNTAEKVMCSRQE